MRFFHLSDLHLGLKLCGRDLSEDQAHILKQITEYARKEQPDAVVIAGDIYDRAVPPAEAVSLFDRFLTGLRAACPGAELMLISGNHDSAPRVNVFRTILRHQNIHMVGMPPGSAEEGIETVTLSDAFGEVRFYLLPFVRPSMVRSWLDPDREEGSLSYEETLRRLISRERPDPDIRNVLVSHQFYLPSGTDPEKVERMDSEIRTVGDIDAVGADVLEAFDYAALGHIHKPMKAGDERFRYCGTPMACSFSEAGQQKGILLTELREKGTLNVKVLPLKPLREVRVLKGSFPELMLKGTEDYVSVTLTDPPGQTVPDLKDRLEHVFPNLLELKRERMYAPSAEAAMEDFRQPDPFGLCLSFLKETGDAEQALLRDVINRVREGQE